MRDLPIHVRLTAWYLMSLTVIVTLFATASWYAMKVSMYSAIDNDLLYRINAVVPFIQSHSLNTADSFAKTFANSSDSSIVGVFVQITGDQAGMLYESDLLASKHIPPLPPPDLSESVSRTTVQHLGWTIRVATERITVNGVPITVHVAEPLTDLLTALHEISLHFIPLVSLALLLTACAGYWISRRALAPVEQIRREAEAIDPADLTARLHVPIHDDELGRLAKTLNSMLARIEGGFQSVERFTSDASHELRAPLAFIITAGDICLRRQRSREELEDGFRKTIAEARRMAKLVEDLLELARGDAHPASPMREKVDLNDLAEEIARLMAPVAAIKDIELRLWLSPPSVHVVGLASDLRRLLLILVDNAIKYTDAGSVSIMITVERSDACILITDSGIGIDPSSIPQIFDRFWRADKVRSRAEGGVGLGLALAAQIVQRHQGTVLVESSPGKGSTFRVKLRNVETAT